jgi:hypothetical protein
MKRSLTALLAALTLALACPPLPAQQAGGTPAQQADSASAPAEPKCKVCVPEVKHNTKTVYDCKCEEYCLPRCSLWSLLCGKCGGAAGCPCCELRTRHVLIKKKAPTCDTMQCVVKEVPTVVAPPPPPSPPCLLPPACPAPACEHPVTVSPWDR